MTGIGTNKRLHFQSNISEISISCSYYVLQYVLLYEVIWNQTEFECLPRKEFSIFFVSISKISLQKLSKQDNERHVVHVLKMYFIEYLYDIFS